VTIFGIRSALKYNGVIISPLAKGSFTGGNTERRRTGRPAAKKMRSSSGRKLFALLASIKKDDPLAAARALPWQKIIEANEG